MRRLLLVPALAAALTMAAACQPPRTPITITDSRDSGTPGTIVAPTPDAGWFDGFNPIGTVCTDALGYTYTTPYPECPSVTGPAPAYAPPAGEPSPSVPFGAVGPDGEQTCTSPSGEVVRYGPGASGPLACA